MELYAKGICIEFENFWISWNTLKSKMLVCRIKHSHVQSSFCGQVHRVTRYMQVSQYISKSMTILLWRHTRQNIWCPNIRLHCTAIQGYQCQHIHSYGEHTSTYNQVTSQDIIFLHNKMCITCVLTIVILVCTPY